MASELPEKIARCAARLYLKWLRAAATFHYFARHEPTRFARRYFAGLEAFAHLDERRWWGTSTAFHTVSVSVTMQIKEQAPARRLVFTVRSKMHANLTVRVLSVSDARADASLIDRAENTVRVLDRIRTCEAELLGRDTIPLAANDSQPGSMKERCHAND